MKHLINYSFDLTDADFKDEKKKILDKFLNKHQLDGIELLVGYDKVPDSAPKDNIISIHLPFWQTWLNVWREKKGSVNKYFPKVPNEYIPRLCGGRNKAEMASTLRRLLCNHYELNPSYATMHVSHIELEHCFTRRFTYTDKEVITSFTELVNQVVSGYDSWEPPVKLGFENTWWPGLNYNDPDMVRYFADQLKFNNWTFVFDVSHLINSNHCLSNEEASIDFVLEKIERLPLDIRERISVTHLSQSQSGRYQEATIMRGAPKKMKNLPFREQYMTAKMHSLNIDRHLPFTSPRAGEILEALSPDYVVHEIMSSSLEELSGKLEHQLKSILINS